MNRLESYSNEYWIQSGIPFWFVRDLLIITLPYAVSCLLSMTYDDLVLNELYLTISKLIITKRH